MYKYTSAPRKRVTQVKAKHKGALCLRDIKKHLHDGWNNVYILEKNARCTMGVHDFGCLGRPKHAKHAQF